MNAYSHVCSIVPEIKQYNYKSEKLNAKMTHSSMTQRKAESWQDQQIIKKPIRGF